MAKILLTGASGFIGNHLLHRLLASGHQVFAIANKTPILHFSKVTNGKLEIFPFNEINLIKSEIDVVFHLATHYVKRNDLDNINRVIDANVMFGRIILDFAIRKKAKFIFTSSYLQYLSNSPESPYTLTKKLFSKLAFLSAESHNLPVTEVIIHDTYGRNDSRDKVLNLIISSSLSDNSFKPENPHSVINLSSVDDVTEILETLIADSVSGSVEIKSEQDITIENLVKMIEYLKNSATPPENLINESNLNDLKGSRIKTIRTKTDLSKGVSELISRKGGQC